jgi:hypothetical protein
MKLETDYIVQAIKQLNPNAQNRIVGDTLDNCTIEWIVGDEISKDDIKSKIDEIKDNELTEATATANKKASGKQKLKDLGLDDAEINALIGA